MTAYEATPTILGQIVGAWVQYCPVFIVFYWLFRRAFSFMLEENLVSRKITHDKKWMEIVYRTR